MNIKNDFKEVKILPFIAILILINLIFFITYYGRILIFIDTSREVFIPYLMNSGEVLYKDIFNVYPPLGYQINAFLTSIKDNLNTFYIAGFINSNLILIGLFLLLRIFTNKKYPFLILSTLLLIISSCFYPISHTGYIFPYSYSIVYALSTFILALTAAVYYIRKENIYYLYTAYFLTGICIFTKYEFFPFILILFGISLFNKLKINEAILCLISFCVVPILSYILLCVQGANFNDIIQAVNASIKLSKSQSTIFLYKFLGFIPTFSSLKLIAINLIKFLACIICIILYAKITKVLYGKINKNWVLTIFLIPIAVWLFLLHKNFVISNAFIFNWIGIIALIIFIIICLHYVKEKKKKEDTIFFISFISILICSYKSIFNISFNSYGTYFFPLLAICIVIFINNCVIKNDFYRKILVFIILATAILYTSSNIERSNSFFSINKVIETNKGNFTTDISQVEVISNTLEYIKSNTNNEDRILVLPEGAIINYLTDRKSNSKYYYLIPPNIDVFTEDKIKKDLEQNLPEYIVIQPMSFNNFNQTYFCESFGKKICELIPKYYEHPFVIRKENNDFWIAIYKLKK